MPGPDPSTSDGIQHLQESIDFSRRQLKQARTHRMESVKEYVGKYYSDEAVDRKTPVNLFELAMTTYLQNLVPTNPKAAVSTPHRQLKPFGKTFELAINHLTEEINLEWVLREAVTEAMMCMGVLKVQLNVSAQHELEGFDADPGQPGVESIGMDDWVHDVNAKNWPDIQYAGDRYRLPLPVVKDSDIFDNTEDLQAFEPGGTNDQGEREASSITTGTGATADTQWTKQAQLWDIWLPHENLLVTIDAEGHVDAPLRVAEWNGPERGPYHLLRFNKVPDQILPLAPTHQWRDMHDLANRVFNKMGRMAERQKDITAVQRGKEGDGKAVAEGDDGEVVPLEDPSNIAELSFGGVDGNTLAFFLQLTDQFSYMAGNLDTLGGLSSQADTLGQEEMLDASSSKRMTYMQNQTQDVTSDVMEDLGYWLWHDPLIDLPLTKRVPGGGEGIEVRFRPEAREGDLMQYNIDINAFSLQEKTPQQKLQFIGSVFQNYIAPFAELMAQQGVGVNWQALLELISQYGNVPELEDVLVKNNSPQIPPDQMVGPDLLSKQQEGGQGGEGQANQSIRTKQSPVTRRTQIRKDRGGGGKSDTRQLVERLMTNGRDNGGNSGGGAAP